MLEINYILHMCPKYNILHDILSFSSSKTGDRNQHHESVNQASN